MILAIPPSFGGHVSTQVIVESMGRTCLHIPMQSAHEIDLDQLKSILRQHQPKLLYLDQATMLFPLDVASIRAVIDDSSPETLIHYDSSHLNGLILGGAIPNPLEHGADLFGGSTHKTLPGPHKGFLATNNAALAQKIDEFGSHFVSHHNSAATVALAVTLLEFQQCGGDRYASLLVENAQQFAARLNALGVEVAAADLGFSGCHQVWVTPPGDLDVHALASKFEACGLILNVFGGLPGISRPSFRISMAEVTRMGMMDEQALELAEIFADLILSNGRVDTTRSRIEPIKTALAKPKYCIDLNDLYGMSLDDSVLAYYEQKWPALVS
jgi:glycine/serine hydroxymethyltransferase